MNLVKTALRICLLFPFPGYAVAQEAASGYNLRIEMGKDLRVFTDSVMIVDPTTQTYRPPISGKHTIHDGKYTAEIDVQGKVFDGTITRSDNDHKKSVYIVEHSMVRSFKMYEHNQLIAEASRDATKAYYKAYDKNGRMSKSGWTSLDAKKHFGKGVIISYFADG